MRLMVALSALQLQMPQNQALAAPSKAIASHALLVLLLQQCRLNILYLNAPGIASETTIEIVRSLFVSETIPQANVIFSGIFTLSLSTLITHTF